MQKLFSILWAVPNPPKQRSFMRELCLFSCSALPIQHKVRLHLMLVAGCEGDFANARPPFTEILLSKRRVSLRTQSDPFSPGVWLEWQTSLISLHRWEMLGLIIEISLSFFTVDLVIVAFLLPWFLPGIRPDFPSSSGQSGPNWDDNWRGSRLGLFCPLWEAMWSEKSWTGEKPLDRRNELSMFNERIPLNSLESIAA